MRRPAVVLAVLALFAGAALTRPGAVPAEQDAATAAALRAQLASERRSGDRLERRLRAEVRRARRASQRAAGGGSVAEALTLAAVVYGVPRAELSSVAWCESRHRPWARNGSSGASGLLQFMPGTFASTPFGKAGLSVFSPYANALAGGWLASRSGWAPWSCHP